MMAMKEVIIYTDGGCRGNGQEGPSLGAIGGVLLYPAANYRKEFKRAYWDTTNNQMELTAVIEALSMLKEPCDVTVHSDSAYVVNAFNQGWVDGWRAKGYHRGKAGELKNRELWMRLDELTQRHRVRFVKVKGHSDDALNARADALVNEAMDEAEQAGGV